MARSPKALLFDLDGTLIDSVPDIAAAMNMVLHQAGREPLDEATIATLVGAGARTLVERAYAHTAGDPGTSPDATETIDVAYADFITAYEANPSTRTRLYPMVVQTLQTLAALGHPLAVVTNKPHALTFQILNALNLTLHFGAIVGAAPERPLKPDRAMVDHAIAQLGVEPGHAVFIGDSRADVEAARAAAIPVILVTHGYMNADPATLKADAIIDGFEALPQVLASRDIS